MRYYMIGNFRRSDEFGSNTGPFGNGIVRFDLNQTVLIGAAVRRILRLGTVTVAGFAFVIMALFVPATIGFDEQVKITASAPMTGMRDQSNPRGSQEENQDPYNRRGIS